MATLRGDTGAGEDRMLVVDPPNDPGGIDRLRAVQGQAKLPVGGKRLEAIHVVRDGGQADGLVHQVEVPARPGAPSARKQALVRVQDGLVALIGEGAQELALGRRRVGQHRQRLVGVGGDHDLVEALRSAVPDDLDPIGMALDAAHRRLQPDAVAHRGDDRLDVCPAAAYDRAPAGSPGQGEDPVVVEELRKEAGRKRPELIRVG